MSEDLDKNGMIEKRLSWYYFCGLESVHEAFSLCANSKNCTSFSFLATRTPQEVFQNIEAALKK
jgi:hypothetical protein